MKNRENFCKICAFAQETYCEKYGECIFQLLIRWREFLRYHHNFFESKMRKRDKTTVRDSASTHIRDKGSIAPIKSDRDNAGGKQSRHGAQGRRTSSARWRGYSRNRGSEAGYQQAEIFSASKAAHNRLTHKALQAQSDTNKMFKMLKKFNYVQITN